MSAEGTTRKRMGITAIISSIFIVASLVWGIWSFALIQSGQIRLHDPHYEYDEIEYWPYTNDFAGRDSNWFDDLNYTDFQLNDSLPIDLLDRVNDTVFYVAPADPGQLWRIESFDEYDGSRWTKTSSNLRDLTSEELIPISATNNTIYTILFNATAGAEVGTISLPALFPSIRIIEDSFETYTFNRAESRYDLDVPTRLLHYDLQTDDYGTLLFSPLIDGITGEDVLVSYMVTFVNQDINQVRTDAQTGAFAPSYIYNPYTDLSLVEPLSQRVTDNTSQFIGVGSNAYETAIAVAIYFQSTFTLNLTVEALLDRPGNQEVTDWFLERGNGLPQDFATAYCVFMRDLGIPARVVSGYALGEPHPTADMRTLMVRHMAFWAEVFIPMSGHPDGGEWIQVIPTPLPDNMGGGEDPGNVPIPDIVVSVWPTSGLIWAEIGTPFGLSATVSVDGVFITTPDTITFHDVTDTELIGTATIGNTFPTIANITYTFPSNSTIDFHIITATWTNPYFQVWNVTQVYAVGTPVPMGDEAPSLESPDAIIAETRELDINLGLNTTIAYWEDTVHVYGIMTVQGVPVNGSNLLNPYIQIKWDLTTVGNVLIDQYGYYEYDVYVDPLDLALMKVGPHIVWSYYAGDWDPNPGFYRLYPANSAYNSTITVWGRVGFDLSVTPESVSAGGTLYYDGAIYFLNGSLLPSGQSVGTFFGTQDNSTRVLNVTGGFTWTYVIPGAQSEGTYFARANWTSPWSYISGNWSISIPIDVGAGGSEIILNPLPDPIFIGETYTISGYLLHVSNGSGIGSQLVDVYWSTGSAILLGSNTTAVDGYFELSYLIPAGYEGAVTYWANFTSGIAELTDSESLHLGTTVKKYDVDITIAVAPDPIHLLQTVTVQGVATLPENASSPLANVQLDIYWANSTYPLGVVIGTTWTNSGGGYTFFYQIPLNHAIETVDVWASFTSLYTNIADGESLHEPLTIELTGTLLTVNSDFTSYYLNETVQLTGHLQFSNGTPIQYERVFIHWINGSGTWVFEKYTDVNGDYQFQYNLSTSMDTGLVDVHVNWTDTYGLYTDAFADLVPSIQLNKYDLQIVTDIATQIYVDETIVVQGVLSYAGGTPPLVGELVELTWWNGTHWDFLADLPTNVTGGFYAELAISQFEYTYNFRLQYYATDPVNNDVLDYFFDVTVVKYTINLDITALPNPVLQNGTLTVHAHLYYAHNGTAVSFTNVSIFWDNGNGTLLMIGNITTDGTGHGDLFYSGMAYDTIRTGIHVYGYYPGTILHSFIESTHTILTLEQWQTDLVGLNTPVGIYNLLDSVVVTGTLYYTPSSIPYGGVTVELLVLGSPVNSTTTLSDGTFTLLWTIPSSTPIGFYDLEVRFTSSYPWILGVQEYIPTIEITAPGYIFSSFAVSPEAPTITIILDYLTIAGVVTWDNGTPYAFSTVSLYWGDPVGVNYWMEDVVTDGAGAFATLFQVPEGTGLGLREVWAYIPPAGIATSGISRSSWIRWIDVELYSLVITATVDVAITHLGDTITIYGSAHFSNGTPLTGYSIEIWWATNLLSIETIDGSGNFSYSHPVPYTVSVGMKSGYTFFNAPTAAFPDITTNFADVEVREYIDLYLDTQPTSNIFSRGDTITVTGYVENDAFLRADLVEIEVLVDGMPSTFTDVTDGTGSFSIGLLISDSAPGAQYIITIQSIGAYYDVVSVTGSWTVVVVIDTVLSIQVDGASYLPGETFTIQLQLFDEDGIPIDGASIDVSFNSTFVDTITLAFGSGSLISVTIPASWSTSGFFEITVDYAGSAYLNGDSTASTDTIHIFTRVIFTNRSPTTVTPGLPFIIEVYLTDPNQNAIVNRPVLVDLNGAGILSSTVDSEGVIQINVPGQTAGVFNFTIILTSDDVLDINSGTFVVMIQTQGGNILQGTDLIIAGVLLVGAIIAVLAYLYIVKGMFRSVVISRGIDIPTKLRNIKKLADAGKYGASITLAYRTFEQMCGSKMGSERTHSETAREYLDRVLQSIPLDGSSVEQFVQTYEEARFSHHEMTRERYEEALRIFTDIYPRIDTGSIME
ncbi:DUF4129 domain-containing protein [Candidatus Thorarchaeota archaeon]|nr:MAG: DUF4129 domain-containing protein [Candidatus Thorarchaeota archaeon]